jgi:hypothetical protein
MQCACKQISDKQLTKPVLAVLNGVLMNLAYIVSQGNITATIIWFAITTGATAGLSYYKEQQ